MAEPIEDHWPFMFRECDQDVWRGCSRDTAQELTELGGWKVQEWDGDKYELTLRKADQ